MEHEYVRKNQDFSVEIKANIITEEQKLLIDSLGHLITSNLCLKDTKLLNTCLNLIHIHSNELLSNMADYVSINNEIELDPTIRDILDIFSNSNNFTV